MTETIELSGLLEKARADFEICKETIRIGSHDISFWRPANPESVLDDETLLSPHAEMAWQPYWAQAWEASIGMCEYLATQEIAGQEMLDLGCGLGLTTALLLEKQATVVCGDNAPPSLLFTEINTWAWRENVTVRLIDWHQTELASEFDVIIGSDIVYDRGEVEPLDRFFRKHLKSAGRVILSDPTRLMTREFLDRFLELGWKIDEQKLISASTSQPTRICNLTLPAPV